MIAILTELLIFIFGLSLIVLVAWKFWNKENEKDAKKHKHEAKVKAKNEIQEVLEKVELVEELDKRVGGVDIDKVKQRQKRIEEVKKI